MPDIRINVGVPKPVDHGKALETGIRKNKIIDRVKYLRSRYGLIPFECSYDEKKHGLIDKFKLEKDLKKAVGKLVYKTS